MGTEALVSDQISKLDATPALRSTSGEGGAGYSRELNAHVTSTSGKTGGSTYRFCRVASNIKLKSLVVEGAAQSVGKYDFGLYYSDSAVDGTPVAYNNGTVINASFFASDYSFASAVHPTNISDLASYTIDQRNKPLWQAAGLAADPGGFLDIVGTLTTTITTGALMGVTISFVM